MLRLKRAPIRRVLDIGPAAASKELGIPSGTLSCWAHKAHQGVAGYALPGPEREPASEPEPPAPPTDQDEDEHAHPRLVRPGRRSKTSRWAARGPQRQRDQAG